MTQVLDYILNVNWLLIVVALSCYGWGKRVGARQEREIWRPTRNSLASALDMEKLHVYYLEREIERLTQEAADRITNHD